MTIDLDMVLRFFTLAFAVGSSAYAYASQRNKATHEQIRILEQKVLRFEGDLAHIPDLRLVETRIQKLEGDLQHVPDKDTLHRLELTMQKVQGEVESMKDQWGAALNSIRRLEEFLLNAPPAPAVEAARKRARK